MNPTDDLLAGNEPRDLAAKFGFVFDESVVRPLRVEEAFDLRLIAARAEQRAVLRIPTPTRSASEGIVRCRPSLARRVRVARLAEQLMPDEQRGSERTARVAGGGLNPQILERAFAEDAAVRHAVERDASREAQFLLAGD